MRRVVAAGWLSLLALYSAGGRAADPLSRIARTPLLPPH